MEDNKFDIEAEKFKSFFGEYKDKKIVIYGIGRRTLTLLPRIREFNVIGLLDRDVNNIGKIISGKQIISVSDAEKNGDLIIINSDSTNYKAIYRRIVSLKIPIFFSNGKKASYKDLEVFDKNSEDLWDERYEYFKSEIDSYDIVTFDVFDTLLTRKILDPSDVFVLLPKKEEVDDTTDNSDLIQLETKLIYPRNSVVSLLKYAVEKCKDVYLITDMYLSGETISKILFEKTHVHIPKENIFVSCEKCAEKITGELWDLFVGDVRLEKKVLHIGDNPIADMIEPKKRGIDCLLINSGKRMTELSCFSNLPTLANSIQDRLLVGLIISRLFNSPFVNHDNNKICFDSDNLGYCVLGPVVYSFFADLLLSTELSKEKKILFVARDGFFLRKDYEFLQECLFKYKVKLPKSIYLPISRRLILISNWKNSEAWSDLISMPFDGTFSDYMKSRFNVEVDERSADKNNKQVDIDLKTIELYKSEIDNEAELERNNYLKYLEKNELLQSKGKDILVDLGCQGTNQYYLQKLTNNRYLGRYFYANLSHENRYLQECEIRACFQSKDDPNGNRSEIRQKSAYLESFLTAPYGMIRYIDKDGNMACEEDKTNQNFFYVKEKINRGILDFIKDMIDLNEGNFEYPNINLINYIYKTVWEGECLLDELTSKSFVFDNDMIGSKEQVLI